MPVSLGMPSAPPPVLAPRRTTRQIQVGSVGVGSQHPVSVQSMTTTKTHDIGATLQQIAELTAAGCDIVRVACPTDKDAEALKVIAQQSTIPVIADIHFQPKYVFAAIEAGCGAVRVNPGNIKKFDDKVKEIAQAASDHGTSSASASTPAPWTRACCRSTARPPRRPSSSPPSGRPPLRGARLQGLQDLRQAQRPGDHGPRLRAARRAG